MAIKTKKISELNDILQSDSTLTDFDCANFYLLGCKGITTGRVSTEKIVDVMEAVVDKKLEPINETLGSLASTPSTASLEDDVLGSMGDKIRNCQITVESSSEKIAALDSKFKNYAFSTTSNFSSVEQTIAKLTERVAALESFVQALQADGYLTLANIKKAAAEACPICTHTHEETAE